MHSKKRRGRTHDTIDARSVRTDFGVIISGAGISRDAPSELPSAAMLVDAVWTAVRLSLGGMVADELDERVRLGLQDMRMEQVLELLTGPGSIPAALLVNVYKLVGGAAFNSNHLRLAALDAPHFTLNMDTLIEEAGPGADVTHLHGLWDQPRTIRTTVSHYSKGLSAPLRYKFGRALRGSHVLVIGYSGRDTDVIPLFDEYRPLTITWVGPDPDNWEPEVKALQAKYDDDGDPRTRFVPRDNFASTFLPELVATVPLPSRVKQPHPPANLVNDLVRETTSQQRLIAVARLLFGMGLNDEIRNLLEHRQFVGPSEIPRRKLVARAHDRQGDPQRALRLLLQRPSRVSEIWPWLTSINEIAAIAPRASRGKLARRLLPILVIGGTVIPSRSMRRRKMLAQIRIAKSLAVQGRLLDAIRLGAKVTKSRRAQYVLGDASLVDALTWYADSLKSRGNLKDAQNAAARGVRLIEYADPNQAAFAQWKLAETYAAAGRDESESEADFFLRIVKLFGCARTDAEAAEARDTLAWIHGTWAEFVVESNLVEARNHIEVAERLGAADRARGSSATAHHLLQRSAVDMFAGDLLTALDTVESVLAESNENQAPAIHLQAEQLLAEIRWRQDSKFDLAADLLALADRFHQHGMMLNEARARVAAASLRGVQVDTATVENARKNGWNDLIRRSGGSEGKYPWPWDILL